MKIKTLGILLVVLILLAVAGTLVVRHKAPKQTTEMMGSPLLEQLPPNKIVSITIKGAEGAVHLVKKGDKWVVKDRYLYPADFSRISDFVRKLKDVKVGRWFESSEDTIKRLGLKDPDDTVTPKEEKGIRVYLRGEGEIPLANILLGKIRMRGAERPLPDGQYVVAGEKSKIYLIDKHFPYLDERPAAWLEKTPIKVEAKEIMKILCLNADGKEVRYTLERPEKGKDLRPLNLPAGSKVKKSARDRLAQALSFLQIGDVMDPSATPESIGMEISSRMEYYLFNGMIYRLYPGTARSESDQCLLKIEVDYQRPPGEKDERAKDGSKQEDAGTEKRPKEYDLEARQLNERLGPWLYVISKWQHDVFVTDLAQLLEKSDGS